MASLINNRASISSTYFVSGLKVSTHSVWPLPKLHFKPRINQQHWHTQNTNKPIFLLPHQPQSDFIRNTFMLVSHFFFVVSLFSPDLEFRNETILIKSPIYINIYVYFCAKDKKSLQMHRSKCHSLFFVLQCSNQMSDLTFFLFSTETV